MDTDLLWSGILTALLGVISFILRNYITELSRVRILINRTREEIAKEYVTKPEMNANIGRVLDRLERLDEKLDKLFEIK